MKLEMEDVLWAKVKWHAEAAAYPSPEEFVQHAIERHIDAVTSPGDDERAARKLQGLGYLDSRRDI